MRIVPVVALVLTVQQQRQEERQQQQQRRRVGSSTASCLTAGDGRWCSRDTAWVSKGARGVGGARQLIEAVCAKFLR